MYVFGSGRCGWRGGEWMRELGLGFTNPVGAGGVLDMWFGPGSGAMLWCYVCVRCESGFSV